MENTKEKKENENPMNGAGEFLYFEEKDVKDKSVEGTVLASGFSNGLIGGKFIKE